jgi:hypothetical protein
MADHFLMKSSVPVQDCLSMGSGTVLENHAALREALLSRIGPEAADLFAEPFVSRDKAKSQFNIAWHTVHPGADRALADLDPVQRRAPEDRLHRLVPKIEALADDPALAPMIRGVLSLASPQDIRVVNGHPVLVNWGVLNRTPTEALAAFMRRDASTVVASAPVEVVAGAGLAAATMAGGVAAAEPVRAGGNAGGIDVPPSRGAAGAAPEGPSRLHPVAWVPLAVLLGLALVTLIWILWPGTRIFPAASLFDEAEILDAQATEAAALRDRRDALRAALEGAQCRADGALVLPGNLTPEGLPVLPEGAVQPAAPAEAAPDAPVAPRPERVEVPVDPADPADTGSLLQAIEARTVLVVASSGDGLSTGSGFVVGPGLIVTNQHVIEGAGPEQIFVTNATLGRAVSAQLLKQAGPFETTGADFALLQIAETSLPAFALADPTESMKLHHVVTAGFPGDVMETDQEFQALMQGDLAAMPDLVVVDGTVNAEQQMMDGVDVLVHSAPLAQGNSGGPLVDFCGRVVGVNTFVRQGPLRTLNFALAARDLGEFLAGTPAAVTPDQTDCSPRVAYGGAATPAAPEAAAEPAAADAAAPAETAPSVTDGE